ncbi:transcription factor Sox-17-alpha-A-like isoform X1 [Dinothrombium tinctorium]|uniref:Transcription factor Sox-17-alpha-A-like isoform X1 n=1 Tax=Dinothrombium tinctorium TaxID=1965070 RepID=A0A3S3RU46_9ACAR|nr:transcription factor Sox-17-alpha-A-like isoform X1 [Dinothrombium tinctorium]
MADSRTFFIISVQVMSCGLTNTATGQHHLGQVTPSATHMSYTNVPTTTSNAGGGGGGGGTGGHHGGNQSITTHHGSNKKHKKPKVNKDGIPAPKRATTAYINFTQWYREELKKSGRPIPKIGEFGKECAGKWNSMNEEDKTPFINTAMKDRERYKKEMAVYKPARDANKPKRPGTAFMLFMADFRKEMAGKEPEGGVAALAKLGGERWRNMSEEEKRPYVEKQNEEKLRYEVNMEDYRRKSAGMTGGPSPKQARLSTEGSEVGSPGDSADSGCANNADHNQEQDGHQVLRNRQNVSTPSPATSSSSPQAQQNVSPGPLTAGSLPGQPSHQQANQTQQQQQPQQQQQQTASQQQNAQQTQSISNNNNNIPNNSMPSLPPLSTTMSLSHALSNHTSLMAGYSQHSFASNFGHPNAANVLAAGAAAAAAVANYNQAHSGNMTGSAPSYLPTGAGGSYSAQSHLPGHYSWN